MPGAALAHSAEALSRSIPPGGTYGRRRPGTASHDRHQPAPAPADAAREAYRQARIAHWDGLAGRPRRASAAYHRRLEEVFRFLVAPGQRVLEVGCGCGDLLAALQPAEGVGLDFSPAMIAAARQRHPGLRFIEGDAHALASLVDGPFDVIILSDLVNDLWDVQAVLEQVRALAAPHTRVVINTYSRLWEPALALAERLGLAQPTLYQNWLTPDDLANLLHLAGFEVFRRWTEIIWPLATPLGAALQPLPGAAVALPAPGPDQPVSGPPAGRGRPLCQGAGRLGHHPGAQRGGQRPQIFARVPELGGGTEMVFVEGHSRDNTYQALEEAIAAHPERRCALLRQTGVGKGDAVRAACRRPR